MERRSADRVSPRAYLWSITGLLLGILTGITVLLLAVVVLLNSHAPNGPSQVKGMEGKYYNWVYTLSPCSSAPLINYHDKNISFMHFALKDAPGMERLAIDGHGGTPLALKMLHYSFSRVYFAGNSHLEIYAPSGRKPAQEQELRAFVGAYSAENFPGTPEIEYGFIPGAVFSAHYRSGSREGICFTVPDGTLYQFMDQNMAMQRGSIPFNRRLLASLGIGAYSFDDYALGGMKDWFIRPYFEKVSECNYNIIRRTIQVGGYR